MGESYKRNVEGGDVKYMLLIYNSIYKKFKGFLGSSVVKHLPPYSGDMNLIPGLGRSYMLQSNWVWAPQPLNLCSRGWEPQLLSLHAATSEGHAP